MGSIRRTPNGMSIRERLLAKHEVLENGCWRFTGKLNDQGYGVLNVLTAKGKRAIMAYRLAHCLRGHELSGDNLFFAGRHKDRRCRACEVIRKQRRNGSVNG